MYIRSSRLKYYSFQFLDGFLSDSFNDVFGGTVTEEARRKAAEKLGGLPSIGKETQEAANNLFTEYYKSKGIEV